MKQPVLLYGDCTKVLKGQFDVVAFMPPWNMPRCHNGAERGYHDDLDEANYQYQQVEKLRFMSTLLRPNALVVYHHRNRVKHGIYVVPEMWIFRQTELVLWDTVTIYKGSTPNANKGRGYPMRETLYLFHLAGANRREIFSNHKPDAYSSTNFDSRHDTWFMPAVTSIWHGSTHNAVAPELLPYRIFNRWCPPGGDVCDPMMGSGTSAIAALKLNLSFTGSEIDPRYFEEAKARVNAFQLSATLQMQYINKNK